MRCGTCRYTVSGRSVVGRQPLTYHVPGHLLEGSGMAWLLLSAMVEGSWGRDVCECGEFRTGSDETS